MGTTRIGISVDPGRLQLFLCLGWVFWDFPTVIVHQWFMCLFLSLTFTRELAWVIVLGLEVSGRLRRSVLVACWLGAVWFLVVCDWHPVPGWVAVVLFALLFMFCWAGG